MFFDTGKSVIKMSCRRPDFKYINMYAFPKNIALRRYLTACDLS